MLLKPLQPNIRLSGQPNIRPAERSAEYSANCQILLQAGRFQQIIQSMGLVYPSKTD